MSTRSCPSCSAPLPSSSVFGKKIVTCDFCGAEVELKNDSKNEIGLLSDHRFERLWKRATDSYEKYNFSKSYEIVDSLLEKLIESNTFSEDLVKVYGLKFSILISAFLVDRDFLGKLERYGIGNPWNYTHLEISNFLSEILESYEDIVDHLPQELQFTFANFCFKEFNSLFGGNLLFYAEESFKKISHQGFNYSKEVASYYYYSFIVKLYYSSIKFIEGVYPETKNKEEIEIIKNICIDIKKTYSEYLSIRFLNQGAYSIDYKILFLKTNIKNILNFDSDETLYEEFFKFRKDFEYQWIPEEAKEINRNIEIKRVKEEEIYKQKLLEEKMMQQQKKAKQDELEKENWKNLTKILSFWIILGVVLGVPIGGTFYYTNKNRIRIEKEKLAKEKEMKKQKIQESTAWKSEIMRKRYANKYENKEYKLESIRKEDYGAFKTVYYSNGDYYYGQILNGVKHGKGTYNWSNGNKYEGDWKDGYKHGQGTFTWSNGASYSGEWRDNKWYK